MEAAEPALRRAGRTRARRSAPSRAAGEFADVLRAAQAGGEWALAALYRAHDPAIRRYLRGQAGQDADDVASQTWIDAARNLHRFRGGEDELRAWLFTIARRRLVDRTRRRVRRPEELTDATDIVAVDRAADPAQTVVDAVAGDEAARLVAEVLPADQAEIVLLRVVGGLDVSAVAEITGKRPGTVRVAQHRALRRLAQALGVR